MSEKLQRYEIGTDKWGHWEADPYEDGDFVLYSDVLALEEQAKADEEMIAKQKEEKDQLRFELRNAMTRIAALEKVCELDVMIERVGSGHRRAMLYEERNDALREAGYGGGE